MVTKMRREQALASRLVKHGGEIILAIVIAVGVGLGWGYWGPGREGMARIASSVSSLFPRCWTGVTIAVISQDASWERLPPPCF